MRGGDRLARGLTATAMAVVAYLALAVGMTWPLARGIASHVPLGTERVATVPHASAWALGWVADRLAAGGAGLWDAPIFHPSAGTFALSEPLLLQGLVAAPWIACGASPSFAHNVVVLISLVANGVAARGLLRALELESPVPFAGGAMVLALPFAHDQLGVLTLVWLGGPLCVIWAALVLARRPTALRGAGLGLAVAATYLGCGQYGLFTVIASIPAAPWLWRRWPWRRAAVAIGAGALVALAAIVPVAWAQIDARRAHGIERSERLVRRHAAAPRDFTRVAPPRPAVFPGTIAAPASARALFPGAVAMVLGGVAVAWILTRPRRIGRRELAFLITFAIAAQLLAVAPNVADGAIYRALRALPGVAQVRALWRAAALWQLTIVVLAAVGLEPLRRALTRRRWGGVIVLGLAGLVVAESWPARQPLAPTPGAGRYAPLARWLADNASPAEPLAFLPAPPRRYVGHYAEWAWWMAAQRQIGHPMVGGYSSYFPKAPYRQLLADLRAFPEGSWPASLDAVGVRYVIAREAWLREREASSPPPRAYEVRWRWPAEGLVVLEIVQATTSTAP